MNANKSVCFFVATRRRAVTVITTKQKKQRKERRKNAMLQPGKERQGTLSSAHAKSLTEQSEQCPVTRRRNGPVTGSYPPQQRSPFHTRSYSRWTAKGTINVGIRNSGTVVAKGDPS
ncbi:hypothetical protein QOT17_004171 [Balamuthia mandrillaris]